MSLRNLILDEAESISIEDILLNTPKALDLTNADAVEVADYLLPYSVGFEIECEKQSTFDIYDFMSIPNILDVDCSYHEQRFRISKGLSGLYCLYDISQALKKNSLLNEGSGIHYHIDCTEHYEYFNSNIVEENESWILEELESWDYKGTYNTKRVIFNGGATWLRFQGGFKTMEFRIGEMTFDYTLLIHRIVHASDIARRFKAIAYAKYLETNSPILLYEDDKDLREFLKNRNKKI